MTIKKGSFCKIVGLIKKEGEIMILNIKAVNSANEITNHLLEVRHHRLKLKIIEKKMVN